MSSKTYPPVRWNEPIEAVKIGTDIVVPVTLSEATGKWERVTKECPDGSTTNTLWHEDGSDYCEKKAWRIRNVQPVSLPTYDENTHVLVERIPESMLGTVNWHRLSGVSLLRYLGIAKPEPTEAYRIAASTGHPVSVVRDILEAKEKMA